MMKLPDICRRIIESPVSYRPERDDLILFLKSASDLLMMENNVIQTSGRGMFVGDLHGDLAHARSAFGLAEKHDAVPIFLGDYVDRGRRQQEVVNLLLARKLEDPEKVIMLRGNHEFKQVNMKWGFADNIIEEHDETIYWLYNCCFLGLPFAVLLNGKVFGIHGGISREMQKISDLDKFEGTSIEAYDDGLGHIWNDPSEDVQGFGKNTTRKVFYTFGRDVFDEFMAANSLELFIRGHSVQPEGYKYYFDKHLISVFSSADPSKEVKPKAVLVKEDGGHEILGL